MALTLIAACGQALAQTNQSPDEQAIRQNAEAFVKAFNAGDSAAVAALWTENGQLVLDAETTLEGRAAIAAEYTAFLKENPDAKITVNIQSIRSIGPNLSIEKGTSEIVRDGLADPVLDEYTLIHVKQDGKWLIATANAVQKAQPLDWRSQVEFLVGDWKAEKDDWRMEMKIEWTRNKSFLKREFSVSDSGQEIRSGIQVIGWDARKGQITSWTFAADGGHARGYFTREEDGWSELVDGTTTDGEAFQSTNVFTQIGDDELLWQSVARSIEDYPLEDTPQVKILRVKNK